MQVVILAGGLATRMRPETADVPKSLLLVAGRPFVDWQLDRLAISGARSVVMCVGYLGEQIESHVRRSLERGMSVSYSYDGEQLAGTGGALRRALARLEPEFVVTYGDSYLPFDYAAPLAALRARPQAAACMSVYQNRDAFGPSNVALEGDWVARYDARGAAPELDHIDYGAIAVRRSLLEGIEDGAVWDLPALWSKLVRRRELCALRVESRFYEIGSPAGREELERYLSREETR